jgi:hypothetical protein
MPWVPTFAHSDNHVGIQIADMLASMITLPMVAAAYGAPASSIHASPRYEEVRENHGDALKALQFRYQDDLGKQRGGIVVSDAIAGRPGALLFGNAPAMQMSIPGQVTVQPTGIVVPPR